MRSWLVSTAIGVAVAVGLTGCGGHDRSGVVRVVVYPWPEGPGSLVASRQPEVDNWIPLSRIEVLVPIHLPINPEQSCDFGAKVDVDLEDGKTITYGPCERPASIERLRKTMIDDWRTGTRLPLRAEQTSIANAYDILHQLGLRVELTEPTAISSLVQPVSKLSPPVGARVPRGSAVRITPQPGPVGSPETLKSNPRYLVPDFWGRSLSFATRWADSHHMFWTVPALPALPASSAPHLFDAYRIIGQQPRPGGAIRQGVMVGKGFKPTPLTLTVVPR